MALAYVDMSSVIEAQVKNFVDQCEHPVERDSFRLFFLHILMAFLLCDKSWSISTWQSVIYRLSMLCVRVYFVCEMWMCWKPENIERFVNLKISSVLRMIEIIANDIE